MPVLSGPSKSIPRLPDVSNRSAYFESIRAGSGRSPVSPASFRARCGRGLGLNLSRLTVHVSHEDVTKSNDLLAAPDVLAEKLGCGLQRCAMPGRGVSKVYPALAQGVEDELRGFGLVQGVASKQIAEISILPLRDHKARRIFLIQEEPSGVRLRILQMIGEIRTAVFPRNFEQIPGVDRRIQIDQSCDALSSPLDLMRMELACRNCCSSRMVLGTSASYSFT